jgi:hypothetical protein
LKPSVLIPLLSFVCLCAVVSATGISWHRRHPTPSSEQLGHAARFNGVYYIVGGSRTNILLVSTNGTNWVEGPLVPNATGLAAVIVAGQSLVVGGKNGIFSSADGTNWSTRYIIGDPSTAGISEFAYGIGRYVAVGDFNGVLVSNDGVSWSNSMAFNSPNRASGVAFGQNRFVAVETSSIRHSTDGVTWTTASGPFFGQFSAVTFGGGFFVAAADGWFYRSPDGITWTASQPTSGGGRGISYADGRYVAVGLSGVGWHSTNGSNWATLSTGTGSLWNLSYAGDRFIGTGPDGRVATSLYGTNWSTHGESPLSFDFFRVAFVNDRFFAGGWAGSIATSGDGKTWAAGSLFGTTDIRGIAYGNGLYIAGGDHATYSSTNATNWTYLPGQDFTMRGLAFGNGLFIRVGDTGTIRTSQYGTNWQLRNSSSFYALSDVIWARDLFVTVGNSGRIMTSPDGTNWANRSVAQQTAFVSVGYSAGRFAALGRFGEIAYSNDGTNWIAAMTPATLCTAIAGGSGLFVATDEYRRLFVSSPSSGWSAAWPRTSGIFRSIAFGNGTFVAVGERGQIWQSEPVVTLIPTTLPGDFLAHGPSERQLEIQRNVTVDGAVWQTLGTVSVSNSAVRWSDPAPPSGKAFYRARLLE